MTLHIERFAPDPIDDGPRLHLLKDLWDNPRLTAPPRAIVHGIAYESRVTLLSATRKSGKSTLVGAAAAALSNGGMFLNVPTDPGVVLWGCFDEPMSDVARRMKADEANPLNVFIAEPCSSAQLIGFAEADPDRPVRMVVVDAIGDLFSREVESENDSSQVRRALGPWRAFARRSGASVVFLHHTTKATGKARGAGAFEEVADVVLTLSATDEDATIRKVVAEGRVGIDSYSFRLGVEGVELADGEPTTAKLVEMVVFAKGPCSTRTVLESVARGHGEVHSAIGILSRLGRIVNRGKPRNHLWCIPDLGNTSGNTYPITLEPALGTPGNTTGTLAGTLECSFPLKGGTREQEHNGEAA